jgi:hypothetical protein
MQERLCAGASAETAMIVNIWVSPILGMEPRKGSGQEMRLSTDQPSLQCYVAGKPMKRAVS